jgi:predicted metalloprotease with PDZ domain
MKYQIKFDNANQQFIDFTVTLKVSEKETLIQLPTWRPGRYQEADFAKNVKGFKVFDDNGKLINFKKTDKTSWLIDTSNTKSIQILYKYYAVELNAGSSFLDAEQLYVNPVNCFVFAPSHIEEKHDVYFELPENWTYAGPLNYESGKISATSYDELADSPFICSPNLQQKKYVVQGVDFYIWFNGIVKPEWGRILEDFAAFTEKQIEKFTEFPVDEYHFLIQILPYKFYHGVEHEKCTVITIGPSYDVFGSLYKELLGVSSHELYHTWNVKAIRPSEMYPYNFVEPNYTKLGYVAEGVTTYQGDLFLYKSGVFTLEQYLKELSQQFQKHFDNFGRFNYSVAESSWDTWLDGYEMGVPGRKISIYTEGCLLAFALDVLILKATDRTRNLDVVMRALYFNHALKDKGVTENDYLAAINNTTSSDFSWFFEQYYNGTKAYETLLIDCLDELGLELVSKPSNDYVSAFLGVKGTYERNGLQVKSIYPGSGADLSGLMVEDTVIAINNIFINNDLDRWLEYFSDEEIILQIKTKQGITKQLKIPHTNRIYFRNYEVVKLSKLEKPQQNMFDAWRK